MGLTCVCGHFHTGTCVLCGCSIYEPDDGDLGVLDGSCLGPEQLEAVPR